MKRILFIAAAIFLCHGISAQTRILESHSRLLITDPEPAPEPKASQWFFRAGLNVMNAAGKDAKGLSGKAAYDFMIGYQKPIREAGAYWGMEFGLGSRGYKVDNQYADASLIAHSVQYSPFTFGWKFAVSADFKIDIHTGSYALYDYAGKQKRDTGGGSQSVKIGDWNGWNRYDAGLNTGTGFWYCNRFNFDFTFQRGFVKMGESSKMFTNNFKMRLGLAF